MGSAVSNGTTSVGTKTHEAGMNLATWTWAGWVKRTGAGESDFRLFNKAVGTAIGSPNITGQSAALTRLRGRHSAGGGGGFDLSITNDGALPANTWVCLFVVAGLGGTPSIRIFFYDGIDSVDEFTYSSTGNSGAALSFNTADLTIFNTTDGSSCYAGKAAYWIISPDVWDNATMLGFATGTLPSGLMDHYWPLQSDGVDVGEVGGFDFTLSNVTFDGADSPPVTYGGETPVEGDLGGVLPSLTAALSGERPSTEGILTGMLQPLSAALTASLEATGALVAVLPAIVGASSGEVTVTGSLPGALPLLTVALVGESTEPMVEGDLQALLPALLAEFAAQVPLIGELSLTLPALTVELTGSQFVELTRVDVRPHVKDANIAFVVKWPPPSGRRRF